MRAAILCLAALALPEVACEQPRPIARYPEGALHVRFEASTQYSGCLIACVAMATNYLADKAVLTEASIRTDLQRGGLDESRVGDVKKWLETKGLHLVTLSGRLDGKPPASLPYWLTERGYPVICVINRQPDNPAHNHAVVVIGISEAGEKGSADTIHYLDPSSPVQLHSEVPAAFETNWGRGQRAMMIVVQPPPG